MNAFFLSLFVLVGPAFAGEPSLSISVGAKKVVYTTTDLMKRKDLETLTVNNPPGYKGKTLKFRAVVAAKLFAGLKIADDSVIQFKSLDGFSAPISKDRLLNQSDKEAIAYLAIEPPNQIWPAMNPGGPSAGPFFLIWKNPELSNISSEEWPYQLAAFEVRASLASAYPRIIPASRSTTVTRGFQVFIKNCFPCHTMNKQGSSNFGPDLNLPMNPTEYFADRTLRQLIRDPQSVRHWPKSRMKGFKKESLSDQDLDHLLAYLKHMANKH